MTRDEIEGLGATLWRAWQAHERLPTPAAMPADLDEGYAVQAALVLASGQAACGWKIGATNPAAQQRLNLPGPVYGRLLAPFVRLSPHAFGDEFALRVLEPEVAVRLGRDLPDRGRPYGRDDVAAAVDEIYPALEVPDARLLAWDTLGAPAFIADNAAAGRLVLGEPCPGWRDLDLCAVPARLLVDGAVAAEGSTADVMGHPLDALAWLANALIGHGRQLCAGDLVTTGTCSPTRFG